MQRVVTNLSREVPSIALLRRLREGKIERVRKFLIFLLHSSIHQSHVAHVYTHTQRILQYTKLLKYIVAGWKGQICR
jgi:predicted permease